MTKQQQRLALTSAFANVFRHCSGQWYYRRSASDKWQHCLDNDPLADLNAIHCVEQTLTEEQMGAWYGHLHKACRTAKMVCVAKATPEQRTEAILRTLNLYHA